MRSIKPINIKNVKSFDPNWIKVNKKLYKISLFITLAILLSKALAMQKSLV